MISFLEELNEAPSWKDANRFVIKNLKAEKNYQDHQDSRKIPLDKIALKKVVESKLFMFNTSLGSKGCGSIDVKDFKMEKGSSMQEGSTLLVKSECDSLPQALIGSYKGKYKVGKAYVFFEFTIERKI